MVIEESSPQDSPPDPLLSPPPEWPLEWKGVAKQLSFDHGKDEEEKKTPEQSLAATQNKKTKKTKKKTKKTKKKTKKTKNKTSQIQPFNTS